MLFRSDQSIHRNGLRHIASNLFDHPKLVLGELKREAFQDPVVDHRGRVDARCRSLVLIRMPVDGKGKLQNEEFLEDEACAGIGGLFHGVRLMDLPQRIGDSQKVRGFQPQSFRCGLSHLHRKGFFHLIGQR